MIARQIFVVDATVVDANGTFNHLSGYPKLFDSKNYENDIDKARRRADGDMSEAYGAMCKVDSRQLQTVILMTADGTMLDAKHIGAIAPLPEPEAVEEPTAE